MFESEPVSARLPRDELQEIMGFAKAEKVDKSAFIKRLIDHGLKNYKLEKALELYQKQAVSLAKASELAGLNIWDFMAILKEHGVVLNYDVGEFRKDLASLKKRLDKNL